MKKRRMIQLLTILTAALLLITGSGATVSAGEEKTEKPLKGTYKVVYEVDPAYDHYYNLKNNNASTYTDVKSTDQKINAFGVWLRAKGDLSGDEDMDVMMTLLNDVTARNGKEKIHFPAGKIVSRRENNQAFVDYNSGFGHANFSDGAVVRIKVSPYNPPQETKFHAVEFKSRGNGSFEGQTIFENIPYGTAFAEAVPAVLRPVPKAELGYGFKGWGVKGMPAENSKVQENLYIYAEFEEATAEIEYTVSDEEGGTVSAERESLKAVNGTPKGVMAEAETAHRFVNWTDKEGKVVSEEEHLIPEKTKDNVYVDQVYTANFEAIDKAESAGNPPQNPPEVVNQPAALGTNTEQMAKEPQTNNTLGSDNVAAVIEYLTESVESVVTASAPRVMVSAARPAVYRNGPGTPNVQEEGIAAAPTVTNIEDNKVPLSDKAGKEKGGWALVNLIMAIAALALCVFLIAAKRNCRRIMNAGSAVLAAASLVILVLTQDFKLSMAITDSWTIPMILLAGMEAVLMILSLRKVHEEN